MRILRNPNATEGGAEPTAPAAQQQNQATSANSANGGQSQPNGQQKPAKPGDSHPDLAKPPAAPNEPPRVQPIWVAPDDWTRQQTELQALREYQRTAQAEAELKDSERIKALAEKGQLDEALKQLNTKFETKLREQTLRAQTIETEWLSEKRNTAIEKALAGRAFNGVNPQDTAAMVRGILENEVEAVREEATGKPLIRDRVTKRPAAEYLQERLDSPAFALFFSATNRGGSGSDGTRPAGATPKTGGDPYDAYAAEFKANRDAARQGKYIPR